MVQRRSGRVILAASGVCLALGVGIFLLTRQGNGIGPALGITLGIAGLFLLLYGLLVLLAGEPEPGPEDAPPVYHLYQLRMSQRGWQLMGLGAACVAVGLINPGEWGWPLLLLGIVGVLVVILWESHQTWKAQQAERLDRLAAFAQQHGFHFAAKPPIADVLPEASFALFREGRQHKVYGWLEGELAGERFMAFDFLHTIGAGKSKRRSAQTVVLLELGPSPSFRLDPRRLVHRIRRWLGGREVVLADAAAFHERYVLRTPDPEEVADLLGTSLQQFLLRYPQWTLAAQDGLLLLYRKDRLQAESHYAALLGFTSAVAQELRRSGRITPIEHASVPE